MQDVLPCTKPVENGVGNSKKTGYVSAWIAFWRTFSLGILLALSSFSWDKTVERFSAILQVPISDVQDKAHQTEALHLTSTWIVMWLWRIVDGQAILQMVLIAIFIDRIWEFLTFMLYVGWAVIIGIIIISEIHIRYLREKCCCMSRSLAKRARNLLMLYYSDVDLVFFLSLSSFLSLSFSLSLPFSLSLSLPFSLSLFLSANCFSPDLLITDNVVLVASSMQVSTLSDHGEENGSYSSFATCIFVGHTYICLLQFFLTHFCHMIIICDCFNINNNSIDWFGMRY
ncbi:unnamed protein product [Acanthosepion pharaonis]|uniref:Uncharacterized protein n=1 Tax=Acanthosepion pharaonis TaxID=158019 RepID=A0A812CBM7_ACAPH|nr:unnamed protein product [Sepia pharaonis]